MTPGVVLTRAAAGICIYGQELVHTMSACLHGCIHCRVAAEGDPVDGLGGRAQVRGDDQALEAVHKLRAGAGGRGSSAGSS